MFLCSTTAKIIGATQFVPVQISDFLSKTDRWRRVNSFNGHSASLRLRRALIKRLAQRPKLYHILLLSFSLCALSHPSGLNRRLIFQFLFPNSVSFARRNWLPPSLSIFLLTLIACPAGFQQLSVIKELTLKELQIGHLSDVCSGLI